MTDTSMADPGDGRGDGSGNGRMGDEGTFETICTIQINHSTGEFKMFEGDEPDEGQEEGAAAGAPGAVGGAAPPGAGPAGAGAAGPEGAEDQSQAPEGESFSSAADLMKAVLEVVQQAEQGGDSEDAGMQAGFDEASPSTQAAPSPIGPNS